MNVVCIKCWSENSLVKLHLDGSNEFECAGCEESFTCEDVRAAIDAAKKWEKVLKWIDAAPEEEVAAAE
jgi:transposase-like protein